MGRFQVLFEQKVREYRGCFFSYENGLKNHTSAALCGQTKRARTVRVTRDA